MNVMTLVAATYANAVANAVIIKTLKDNGLLKADDIQYIEAALDGLHSAENSDAQVSVLSVYRSVLE